MDILKLSDRAEKDRLVYGDLHVLRFYSSFVTVSRGKVLKATRPYLEYCPLAASFYSEIRRQAGRGMEETREAIKKIIEKKIAEFGFFTENRKFSGSAIAVPYGASEILMSAMKKKLIDAAVIVCDGAGTVIVDRPDIVQGIGARMNGLFFTSPIDFVRERLRRNGCKVLFPDALIDQVRGAEIAAELGYKKIAVTVNAFMDRRFDDLEKIGKKHNVKVTSLAICTTGVKAPVLREIMGSADLIWSCASGKTRELAGEKALLQVSRKIPVFVLTQKGLDLLSGYASDPDLIKNLDPRKQYIVDSVQKGTGITMGRFQSYLREEKLPVIC